MTAELFAISSALFLATSSIIIRIGLRKASPFSSLIAFSTGMVFIWLIVLITGYEMPSSKATIIFAVRGLFEPGLAALLLFTAFKKVGVTITVPIIAASPLISTTLSVLILKENITLPIIFGTILVMGGVISLVFRHPHTKINKKYILLAVAGSTLIGIGAVITKSGLNISNTPISGLAISMSAAILLQIVVITFLKKWAEIPKNWEKAKLFMIAGIISSIGFILMFLALSIGLVSVVFPLISIQPLFALILSRIFLKKHETITRYVILGTVMIVAGASILTLV